jgi:hypothetical protein
VPADDPPIRIADQILDRTRKVFSGRYVIDRKVERKQTPNGSAALILFEIQIR